MKKKSTFRRRRYIPKPRPQHYKPDFLEYERLKREWVYEHPDANPEDYQRAMGDIAQRCGI